MECEQGQASVELVAVAGAVLLASLIGFQLLAAGYAVVMADHAAEAAAIALVNRRPTAEAAVDAVPGWPRRALRVRRERGMVAVTLLPPSPLAILRDRLSITGRAAVSVPAEEVRPEEVRR
jgi:hypothetical protein